MRLALWDVDGTLLAGDHDVEWARHLAGLGVVDEDPIARFRQYLEHKKLWSEAFEQECVEGAKAEVGEAVTAAEAMPNVGPDTLFDDVYMNLTPQLREQRQELHDLMAKGGVGADVGHFPL